MINTKPTPRDMGYTAWMREIDTLLKKGQNNLTKSQLRKLMKLSKAAEADAVSKSTTLKNADC